MVQQDVFDAFEKIFDFPMRGVISEVEYGFYLPVLAQLHVIDRTVHQLAARDGYEGIGGRPNPGATKANAFYGSFENLQFY